jgi:hypothetical protein
MMLLNKLQCLSLQSFLKTSLIFLRQSSAVLHSNKLWSNLETRVSLKNLPRTNTVALFRRDVTDEEKCLYHLDLVTMYYFFLFQWCYAKISKRVCQWNAFLTIIIIASKASSLPFTIRCSTMKLAFVPNIILAKKACQGHKRRRHNTQPNDTKHNDNQLNNIHPHYTQHNDKQHNDSIMTA